VAARSNFLFRALSSLDRAFVGLDTALRTLAGSRPYGSGRPSPALSVSDQQNDAGLSPEDAKHSAALMRVNHSGEVSAQALYQGQAAAAENGALYSMLQSAAREEADHLRWTEERIEALGGRASLLNPVWFTGAFLLGYVAGRMGGPVSLGFLSETERQVEAHLQSHLRKLPAGDAASRQVLLQMIADESEHGLNARRHGAKDLPKAIQSAMQVSGRLLTTTAYYI
jgi:ubiquinone biosynthesis monooxygenase Coq7